jgi:hypothetical protein
VADSDKDAISLHLCINYLNKKSNSFWACGTVFTTLHVIRNLQMGLISLSVTLHWTIRLAKDK